MTLKDSLRSQKAEEASLPSSSDESEEPKPEVSSYTISQLEAYSTGLIQSQLPLQVEEPASSSDIGSIQNGAVHEISSFEGPFKFNITHPREENSMATKGASWTYSWSLDELFVKMDVDCPILVHVQRPPPKGSIIRATPYYLRPEDQNHIPRRCLNHSSINHETNRGQLAPPDYLIRSYVPSSDYQTDSTTGRMSTVVPYVTPDMGLDFFTFVMRFMCRTSCTGGMNRRPICVVFTLEYNGECLGHQVKKVRVCACPGRDKNHEEMRLDSKLTGHKDHQLNALQREVKKACKRIGSGHGNSRQKMTKRTYTITVHSRRLFNFINDLIPVFERHLGAGDDSEEEEV